MSASVAGRRYARRASVRRISSAQLGSSAAALGWQTKIRLRLGVSPGPVAAYGPRTVAIAIAGSVPRPRMRPRVMPSSSASERSTNVMPTRCGPAASGARNVTCSLLRRGTPGSGPA